MPSRSFIVFAFLILTSTIGFAANAFKGKACKTPPVIDGKLNDTCWSSRGWQSGFTKLASGEKEIHDVTKFQFAYDKENLYLAVRCQRTGVGKMRQKHPTHDSPVWKSESVALFLAPSGMNGAYYQIAFNPWGGVYDESCVIAAGATSHNQNWNPSIRIKTQVKKDSWTAELAFPWSQMDLFDSKGKPWKWNLVRKAKEMSTYAPMRGLAHQLEAMLEWNVPEEIIRGHRWRWSVPAEVKVVPQNDRYRLRIADLALRNGTETHQHRKHVRARLLGKSGRSISVQDGTLTVSERKASRWAIDLPALRLGENVLELSVFSGDPSRDRLLHQEQFFLDLKYDVLTLDVTRPWYRNTIYATEALAAIEGQAILQLDDNQWQNTSLNIALYKKDQPASIIGRVAISQLEPKVNFRIPIPSLESGEYVLHAQLMANGKEMKVVEKPMYVAPPVPNEWMIDEKNVLLHNGKPVLPLGYFDSSLLSIPKSKKEYVNVAVSYGAPSWSDEKFEAKLEDAARHNVRLLVYPYSSYSILERIGRKEEGDLSQKDLDAIARRVRKFKGHPGLLGWYLVDEPDISPWIRARLRAVYETCRREDPYHPCVFLTNTLSGFNYFTNCGDVLMPDPYPDFLVAGHAIRPIGMVSKFIQIALESGKHRRAAWLTPQIFSAMEFNARRIEDRAPNFSEIRNMIYQGVIAGAKGFLSYKYRSRNMYPDLYIGCPYIYEELTALQSFVLADDAGLVKSNHTDLYVTSRRVGEQIVVVAVNVATNKINAKLSLSGPAAGIQSWKVFGEGQSREPSDGAIIDTFDGYETHVYVTGGVSEPKETLKDVNARIQKIKDELYVPNNLANRSRGTRIRVDADIAPYCPSYATLIDGTRRGGKSWGALARNKPTTITIRFKKSNTIGRIVIWGRNLDNAKIPAVLYKAGKVVTKISNVKSDIQKDHIILTFPAQNTSEVILQFPPKTDVRISEVEMFANES